MKGNSSDVTKYQTSHCWLQAVPKFIPDSTCGLSSPSLTTCGSFCLTAQPVSVCLPPLISFSFLVLAPHCTPPHTHTHLPQNSFFECQSDVPHSPHFRGKGVLVLLPSQILMKRVAFTQHMKDPAKPMISAFTWQCKCQHITFHFEKGYTFSLYLPTPPSPHTPEKVSSPYQLCCL